MQRESTAPLQPLGERFRHAGTQAFWSNPAHPGAQRLQRRARVLQARHLCHQGQLLPQHSEGAPGHCDTCFPEIASLTEATQGAGEVSPAACMGSQLRPCCPLPAPCLMWGDQLHDNARGPVLSQALCLAVFSVTQIAVTVKTAGHTQF